MPRPIYLESLSVLFFSRLLALFFNLFEPLFRLGQRVLGSSRIGWLFVGPNLLVFGLFTRPVAFILAAEMAYAFWAMHVPMGGSIIPVSNGGDAAVLFCFVFLYLVFSGPGAWALDHMLGTRRKPAAA